MSTYRSLGRRSGDIISAKQIEEDIAFKEAFEEARKIQARQHAAEKIKANLNKTAKNEGGGGGGFGGTQIGEVSEFSSPFTVTAQRETPENIFMNNIKERINKGQKVSTEEWGNYQNLKRDLEQDLKNISKSEASRERESIPLKKERLAKQAQGDYGQYGKVFGKSTQTKDNSGMSFGRPTNQGYSPFNRKLATEDKGMQNAMSSGFRPMSKYAPEYDAVSRIRRDMGYNGGFRGSVRSDRGEALARYYNDINSGQDGRDNYRNPYNPYDDQSRFNTSNETDEERYYRERKERNQYQNTGSKGSSTSYNRGTKSSSNSQNSGKRRNTGGGQKSMGYQPLG